MWGISASLCRALVDWRGGLKTPILMHATPTAKNTHTPANACLCNGAETSLPWKLLRTILSLVQVLCRLLFAARLATGSTKSVARRCSLKKTVQIHASSRRGRCCVVAQASFDHLHTRRCKTSSVGQSAGLSGVSPEVVDSIPAKTKKPENSDLHGFEVYRPSSKGTKLLFQVIKAIINQSMVRASMLRPRPEP